MGALRKKVVKGASVISLEVVVDNWHQKNLLECIDVGVVYGRQVVVDVDPVENLAQDTNLTEDHNECMPMMSNPMAFDDCT